MARCLSVYTHLLLTQKNLKQSMSFLQEVNLHISGFKHNIKDKGHKLCMPCH